MIRLERCRVGWAGLIVLFTAQGCGSGDSNNDQLTTPDASDSGGSGGVPSDIDSGSGGMVVGGGSGGMDASPVTDASTPTDASTDASSTLDASSGEDASSDASPGPNPLDRWVDPIAGSDDNDGTSPLTAFKRVDTALLDTLAGGTLWLMNGEYSEATGQLVTTGYNAFTIPDGVNVRAVDPGMVVLGAATGAPPGFVFEGSGELSGVQFDYVSIPVKASAGNVSLQGISFAHAGGGCSAFDSAAIVLSGTAVVTLKSDGLSDYVGEGSSVRGFALLSDTAQLTIDGGNVSGLLGSQCSPSSHFTLIGSSKLTLAGVTVNDAQEVHRGGIITMRSPTTEVTLNGTTFDGIVAGDGTLAGAAPVCVDGGAGSPKVTVTDSTFQNLSGHPAIQLGYENGASTPIIEIADSTFTATGYAITANSSYAPATPTITVTNSDVTNSASAAYYLSFGGSLTITGGSISENGTANGAIGGVYLSGTSQYTLLMRDVSVTDNVALGGTSGGVVLAGSADSSFDLGSVGDPGGNIFTGNGQTGVRVNVAAGVTVNAVGNTWNEGVQGSTDGTYSVNGPGAVLDLTTGDGTNYAIGSGTLRLAENP